MKRILGAVLLFAASLASAATLAPIQMLSPTGSTAGQSIVSTGPSTPPGWANAIAGGLSPVAANTVIANATASSASPTAFAMPSCSTTNSALKYTSASGFSCGTTFALTTTNTFSGNQTISGATALFTANDTSGTGFSKFLLNNNGTSEWGLTNVSTTNLFRLDRYVSNAYVDSPITIANATGIVTMTDGITGSPISGSTGSFTTLAASSTVSGTGFSNYLLSPPPIGATTPNGITGTLIASTGNFVGPAAGFSIATVTGASSGGAVQIFDATHGNQVNIQNAGATVAAFGSGGITIGTGYPLIPASVAGIKGTTTNDTVNAGGIGENLTGSTSGTSVTNNTATNCTSVSLTAGNWLVWGVVSFAPNASTTVSQIVSGISTTSATLGATGTFTSLAATLTTAAAQSQATPAVTLKLASTTTVYLIGQSQFATSTMTCSGNISALRIR